MKNKEAIKKELEGLSPFLSKELKKETGFETPRNYFHNLQLDIMQQVREEIAEEKVTTSEKEPSVSWLHTLKSYLFQPQYALAFSAIIAIVISTSLLLQPSEADCLSPLCDLTMEEASQFIDDNIEDFSMDMILEVTANEEEPLNLLDLLEGIENEEIDEYLEDMMEEEDGLVEELM